MPVLLQPTQRIELELPGRLSSKEPTQLQRTLLHHLLLTGEITMAEAIESLAVADQAWLVQTLLQDAQEALLMADTVTEPLRRTRFWTQFHEVLGYLFYWHEHWSEFHNELLALLQTVARRYPPQAITSPQITLLLHLLQRLHETHLVREDVFAAKRALYDQGLETVLDLTPVANQLFTSYLHELNRA